MFSACACCIVTHAFLVASMQHSSLVHIGLSTWALLSFGPGVESAYGSVGFGMIYLIGGLFGNLMSFFHTPQGTVGGTVSLPVTMHKLCI
jgi:membrane associated rhomboid family serine protease